MSIITKKQGTLEYLTAEGISVPHCFTTKLGGVSTGVMAGLNIAIKLDETEENNNTCVMIVGGIFILTGLFTFRSCFRKKRRHA